MRKQNTYIDKPAVIVAAVKVKAIPQKPWHGETKLSRRSTSKAAEHRPAEARHGTWGPVFVQHLGQGRKTASGEHQEAHTCAPCRDLTQESWRARPFRVASQKSVKSIQKDSSTVKASENGRKENKTFPTKNPSLAVRSPGWTKVHRWLSERGNGEGCSTWEKQPLQTPATSGLALVRIDN